MASEHQLAKIKFVKVWVFSLPSLSHPPLSMWRHRVTCLPPKNASAPWGGPGSRWLTIIVWQVSYIQYLLACKKSQRSTPYDIVKSVLAWSRVFRRRHLGRSPASGGPPWTGPSLAQVMVCRLFDASRYQNHSWIIVYWNLGNKFQLNFDEEKTIFMQENGIENVICKMAVIFSHTQISHTMFYMGSSCKLQNIVNGDKMATFLQTTLSNYTLGKKGWYTPIEDNKTNVDRTFVFPLGWNWHDMDPWLFPNEIRHYLGQTFNARSSGIVELRNHSIGGRSPKSIFTLWQLWINICIFFQKFFWLFEQCPVQPLWVLGMRCLHLPVRALSKVLLLPVWVRLVLPSTAYPKGMLPLDLWCQASLQGLPERQHLGKTVHCWGWSDRIVAWVLGPWRRGWEICTEWGLVAQWLTTDFCPVVTGHIDPQRSPCWLPTTVVSAWSGRRGGGTWQWPTGSMSSSVMSRDSNFTR